MSFCGTYEGHDLGTPAHCTVESQRVVRCMAWHTVLAYRINILEGIVYETSAKILEILTTLLASGLVEVDSGTADSCFQSNSDILSTRIAPEGRH